MALHKIPIKGSTVKITAKGGANTSAEVVCVKGDFVIDWGSYANEKIVCHKLGVTYDKSSFQEFGTTTLETWFTGDKTDAFQKLMFDALNNKNDFDNSTAIGDRHALLEITFADQDSTVITFEFIMMKMESTFNVQGYLDLKMSIQQTSEPIIT